MCGIPRIPAAACEKHFAPARLKTQRLSSASSNTRYMGPMAPCRPRRIQSRSSGSFQSHAHAYPFDRHRCRSALPQYPTPSFNP